MTGLLHVHFFSSALGVQSACDVILPQPAPGERPPRRGWACLWLLHGLSDDHSIWQRRTSIERYVDGRGLAVVMPAVNRSFYADMKHGGRYWTFVSEELPALCRAWFPLSAARADNFVAGLSMGGYGAFKLALRCPDRYAAAASLSGALDMAAIGNREDLAADARAVFGDPRRVAGSGDDLLFLARKLARSRGPKPRLYQCCGTEDFLYPSNVKFRSLAEKLRLPLTYEDGPGAHTWDYWDRQIQRVLEWLPVRARR
jgi:S-formylglutathione hydrolase FrmB